MTVPRPNKSWRHWAFVIDRQRGRARWFRSAQCSGGHSRLSTMARRSMFSLPMCPRSRSGGCAENLCSAPASASCRPSSKPRKSRLRRVRSALRSIPHCSAASGRWTAHSWPKRPGGPTAQASRDRSSAVPDRAPSTNAPARAPANGPKNRPAASPVRPAILMVVPKSIHRV